MACTVRLLGCRLFRLRPRVVVCKLHPYFSCIFPSKVEVVPCVALSAARNDDVCQTDPGLANELSFLVVIEDGNLEVVVIRRVVNGKSKFLVPKFQVNVCELRIDE